VEALMVGEEGSTLEELQQSQWTFLYSSTAGLELFDEGCGVVGAKGLRQLITTKMHVS